MADFKQCNGQDDSVRITGIGVMLKKGRRFTNEEFRRLTGLDVIYKEHKDKKIIYRAVTEILKIYIAREFIKIIKTDSDMEKKSRGRPQTIYECQKDLDLDMFPFIREVKQSFKCHYCNYDIPMKTKPKYCPNCGKIYG